MQCKDIPDAPILKFLAAQNRWCTAYEASPGGAGMPSVVSAMPEGTPFKLRQAKMASLIRRGLADGCTCGCRGDYEITDKGRASLGTQSPRPTP